MDTNNIQEGLGQNDNLRSRSQSTPCETKRAHEESLNQNSSNKIQKLSNTTFPVPNHSSLPPSHFSKKNTRPIKNKNNYKKKIFLRHMEKAHNQKQFSKRPTLGDEASSTPLAPPIFMFNSSSRGSSNSNSRS